MPPLPPISLRCAAEHAPLIRAVARALRSRPELAPALEALLAAGAADPAPAPILADILERLSVVERALAERAAAPEPVPQPDPAEVATAVLRRATEAVNAATAPDPAPPADPEAPDDFPARMAAARKERGWSFKTLAAAIGLSPQALHAIETGKHHGKDDSRARIAALLGFTV